MARERPALTRRPCVGIKDANLRHTLQFGIGLHHAGLTESDRSVVETLFCAQKIQACALPGRVHRSGHSGAEQPRAQVLVATSTLAWGVNTPTHLVIIKGTEFFDAPTKRCAAAATRRARASGKPAPCRLAGHAV